MCNLADGSFMRPQSIPPHKLGHPNPQCPTNACTRVQIMVCSSSKSARGLCALPWRAAGCLEGWRLRPPCHRTFCKGPFVPPVGRECRATFASAWLRVTPLLSCLAWVWLCTHPGLAAPVCTSSRSYHPSLPLSVAFFHPAPTGDSGGVVLQVLAHCHRSRGPRDMQKKAATNPPPKVTDVTLYRFRSLQQRKKGADFYG